MAKTKKIEDDAPAGLGAQVVLQDITETPAGRVLSFNRLVPPEQYGEDGKTLEQPAPAISNVYLSLTLPYPGAAEVGDVFTLGLIPSKDD